MPDETKQGHGSQVLHQWTWQILLGGFCASSAAAEGSVASFSGPQCFAQQYDLQHCPNYHSRCQQWNNCVLWQCGNSVLCTLTAVNPWTETQASTSMPSVSTTSTQSTTSVTSASTTSMESMGLYLDVDGGEDRACRGASASDNSPSHYTVHVGVETFDSCKQLCSSKPECVGIEYSGTRCEIWTRAEGIQSSIALGGFQCYRKASLMMTTSTTTPDVNFSPVDGGVDRACRGQDRGDNSNLYYTAMTATSLESCKELCIQASGCVGIEFKGSRCEVWTREEGIEASIELSGFTCLKYAPQRRLSVLI